MGKISIGPENNFCPQTLFLYGTYKEDGTPNFGLFCWFSYCRDGELGVMACIGGEKLTKDRIRESKVFSANLVTESLLEFADYLGNTEGHKSGKMDIPIEIERGAVLNVPVLKKSPWVFELEVKHSIPLNDGEVFLCKIRNTIVDKALKDPSISVDERLRMAAPVMWIGEGQYYTLNYKTLGKTGDWKDLNFTK
ncbi:flavin reductase family protein [Defluviitalea raffinosedens]|uniref:Flavin reductase n=1 Tax=Defluviitalea raffinosedens TaxID=1450156 RepID=A0A7C8LNU3_9FIRM|nr:flavin reductase [Defluviitalea raffinosedens]KAE9630694.1 flavin reductase [Defluviitalea raffinosedens]MBM7686297.1 flavin reductase (DIM6/NTAB) family NADH-FMN oxidoreductase RutF [Defluviitalea raffinosedens]HHW67849.1 flavin reductase [Candidatus Epulonipiscium sp.]